MIEPGFAHDLARHRMNDEIERRRVAAIAASCRRRRRRERPPARSLVRVRVAAWLHELANHIEPVSSRARQPTA